MNPLDVVAIHEESRQHTRWKPSRSTTSVAPFRMYLRRSTVSPRFRRGAGTPDSDATVASMDFSINDREEEICEQKKDILGDHSEEECFPGNHPVIQFCIEVEEGWNKIFENEIQPTNPSRNCCCLPINIQMLQNSFFQK